WLHQSLPEFIDYRELFSESCIERAAAFVNISLRASKSASLFFSSRISICSGLIVRLGSRSVSFLLKLP
ncbi:TPA: hypothetical protein ACHGOF_004346, partial [Escherichia coli]